MVKKLKGLNKACFSTNTEGKIDMATMSRSEYHGKAISALFVNGESLNSKTLSQELKKVVKLAVSVSNSNEMTDILCVVFEECVRLKANLPLLAVFAALLRPLNPQEKFPLHEVRDACENEDGQAVLALVGQFRSGATS
jgi:hypothetical protein